jgi:hypothetical protein
MLRLAALALVAATAPVFAQSPGGVAQPAPVLAPAPDVDGPAAAVSRRGILIATINLEITSSIPAKNKITCSVSMSHSGDGASYSETATGYATRTGNTGKCIIRIPYSWPKANPGGIITYGIGATTTGTDAFVINGFLRSHNRYESAFGVPANEATTRITHNVRL